MHCLDCDAAGVVGICVECGAAVCRQHVVVSAVQFTCLDGDDQILVEPAARQLRCVVCSAAYAAATT